MTEPHGTEAAGARVARLLSMVPWLVNRQGVDIRRAAAELDVTESQLRDDLALLFMCGYGSMTDELIDVSTEGDQIHISNADTIARPLRLTRAEALTLIVALRALSHAEGVTDFDVVERTMAKLEDAIGAGPDQPGDLGADTARIAASLDDGSTEETRALLKDALARHHRVALRYLVPARDESTERDVDPMRLAIMDGRWYLEAWCHRAEDTRMFRLDRIQDARILDVDGTPPAQATARDLSAGTFVPRPDDLLVTLALEPGWEWVAEYYPIESRTVEPGGVTITLRAADPAWVVRLALRAGGGVRVVHPTELAAEVGRAAGAALAAYDQGGDANVAGESR